MTVRSGASVYGRCSQAARNPRVPPTNRSPTQTASPSLVHQCASSYPCDQGSPRVTDYFDAITGGTNLQPVVEPVNVGAGAFVHRDDARCCHR